VKDKVYFHVFFLIAKIFGNLMAAQDFLKYLSPIFCKSTESILGMLYAQCYENRQRIDVQSDRKTLRKKPTRLKLTYVVINIGENLNNLPIQTGIVTRQLSTRSKNVGDFLYDKYRVIHNVLQDYKNLLQENRRTRIYETCTDRRNNSNIFFPVNCFSS
jgi:hypothetical protein